MDYQIDWDNIICVHEVIKPKRKEQDELFAMVRNMKMETYGKAEKPEIVTEDELKSKKWAIVEIKQEDPWLDSYVETGRPVLIGLVDVKVDKTRKEFSGTRVMVCVGQGKMFERFTFRTDKYKKFWRVWNLIPSESLVWDS